MRKALCIVLGIAAACVEVLAVCLAIWCENWLIVFAAVTSHGFAGTLAVLAARVRGPMPSAEFDALVAVAFFIPIFGPGLAWTIPLGARRTGVAEADEMLAAVDERLDQAFVPSIFKGDFEVDLSRQVNTVSYQQVLAEGDLEQRRDVIRKLARLGEPKHFEMLKTFLVDPETEIRLCAYLELDRIRQGYEKEIAEKREAVDEAREDNDASMLVKLGELAEVQRAYGASGVLDGTMATFRLSQSVEACDEVLSHDPANPRALIVRSRACAELGRLDDAEEGLNALPIEIARHPAIELFHARICYLRRDFDAARECADRLVDAEIEIPAWLEVILSDQLRARVRAASAARKSKARSGVSSSSEIADVEGMKALVSSFDRDQVEDAAEVEVDA